MNYFNKYVLKVDSFASAQNIWGVALKSRHGITHFSKIDRSESTFYSSFMNYDNNDDCIKQLVLTVGKPLSNCQTSDRRYIYSSRVRNIRTIYVYVIFMVYSDNVRLRHIYSFYFSSKNKLAYIPGIYLKYNVRKVWSDGQRTFHGRSNV